MILVNAQQMRSLDAAATRLGISPEVLMENAALALASEAVAKAPEKVLIFTGKGQNAGDGFAAARHLYNKGINTEIVMLAAPELLSGAALKNYEICSAMGIKNSHFSSGEKYEADIVLDCLLGTGFSGDLTDEYKAAVQAVNESGAYIISADIPSGVSSNTGKIGGICVKADKTVTFGFAKLGLYSPLSADFVGDVTVADISIPRDIPNFVNTYLLTQSDISLPHASKSAHKGTNGRVAIAGGSVGKLGAVILASDAALHSGAGLVTCLVPERLTNICMTGIRASMCAAIEDADFSKYDSVLIGNGLGTSSGAYNMLQRAVKTAKKTLVIDADGINLLANNPDILKSKSCDVILTPHPLEFARLCQTDVDKAIENRVEFSARFAREYGVTVAFKGAHTVVALPNGHAYINNTGNEGMAKGGSGDILAGMIAGIAPRFSRGYEACLAGVYLHGVAGDIAAANKGTFSMTSDDIINNISAAFMSLE